jgi:hypothetical protein
MDDNLLKMIKGGSGVAPSPPASPALGGDEKSTPLASPMSTPEPMDGKKQAAKINVQMAMDLLERSLPAFGTETPEGASLIKVLHMMGKSFGAGREKTKELVPAEIMQLMKSLPKGAGAPPAGAGMPPAGVGGAPTPPMPPAG